MPASFQKTIWTTAALSDVVLARSALTALFPSTVEIGCVPIPSHEARLLDGELEAVRFAAPTRRADFTAGRAAARMAMRGLGLPPVALPRLADGRPDWPEGVSGSISHADALCAAVLSCDPMLIGIGLDIEVATPLEPDLVPLICLPSERDMLASWSAQTDFAKLIFSAKEAFYKCIYPVVRTFVDFNEVQIEVARQPRDEAGSFSARLLSSTLQAKVASHAFVGRWRRLGRYVACGATLVKTEPGASAI